jgi:hypothetical protein
MLWAAFAFVTSYGSPVPLLEDWDLVPVFTGHQPLTLRWLWSQNNEHRNPFPRLILVGLDKGTGYNFRAGAYFSAASLAALAFIMILVSKKVRGWTSYTDAFFPLILLHLGQFENLLWSWQLTLLSSAIVASVLLLVIVHRGNHLSFRAALLASVCLNLLPLCGANGLLLVPFLATWLGYEGARSWLSPVPQSRRTTLVLIGSSLSTLVVMGLYFVGYEPVSYAHPSAGVAASLRTALQVLSMSLGPPPASVWYLWGIAVVSLLVASVILLIRKYYSEPLERPRALGLFLFLAAMMCLALGIGWGRSGYGEQGGLASRYVTLIAPALCCCYLMAMVSRSSGGRVIQAVLLLFISAMLLSNIRCGCQAGKVWRSRTDAFVQDMRAGVPPFALAERYWGYPSYIIYPSASKDYFADCMCMLRDAEIGPFRDLQEDPPIREVTLQTDVGELRSCRIGLTTQQKVYAVRLRYDFKGEIIPEVVQVRWQPAGQTQNDRDTPTRDAMAVLGPNAFIRSSGEPQSAFLWVDDTVDRLLLRTAPGFAQHIAVREIVLVLPAGEDEHLSVTVSSP